MCNGSTALTTQLAGTATSAIGAYFTAAGEKNNLETGAIIADTNARLSDLTAKSATFQGQRAEQASRLKTRSYKEGQRSDFAAQGIDLGSDTVSRVLASTEIMGEIEANTIAADAVRTAWGYKTQGVQYRNEALTKRASSKAISPAGRFATSLLGGAGPVAENWYKYGKAGELKGTAYGSVYDKLWGRN